MYPGNLELPHRNARLSLPLLEEVRNVCPDWTQQAHIPSAAHAGPGRSHAAGEENGDAGLAHFAILIFERGRRLERDRPTSFRFPAPFPSSASCNRHFRNIAAICFCKTRSRGVREPLRWTAMVGPSGTLPATESGHSSSVIFGAGGAQGMMGIYASFSSDTNQKAVTSGEGPQ